MTKSLVAKLSALVFAVCLAVGTVGCAEQKCCGPDCQKACCKDKSAQKCPPDCQKPCCKKA